MQADHQQRGASLDRGGERGAGTVLVAALAIVLCVLLAALAAAVQAGITSARASKAADLAALAAADAARGLVEGEPCALAVQVAGEHGAEVRSCIRSSTGGVVVDIDAAVRLPALFGFLNAGWAEALGRARAGPPP